MLDVSSVNGRYYAGIILEFVEVLIGSCMCIVEWVAQSRIVGTEGKLIDDMGEVEFYYSSLETCLVIS